MKLHHHSASPFVRMCLVTAHETEIVDEISLVPVGMFSPVVEHDRLVDDNPLGRVPVLVTDHGHVLYDSRVICEYLCHHAGDKRERGDRHENGGGDPAGGPRDRRAPGTCVQPRPQGVELGT